jgi:hypothetical protein
MPDENLDLNELPGIATKTVHDWIVLKGVDDPSLGEAMAIVRSGSDFERAAKDLATWFLERLTVDPGIPGPFSDLGYQLISTMLDLVDWKEIVRIMRTREY